MASRTAAVSIVQSSSRLSSPPPKPTTHPRREQRATTVQWWLRVAKAQTSSARGAQRGLPQVYTASASASAASPVAPPRAGPTFGATAFPNSPDGVLPFQGVSVAQAPSRTRTARSPGHRISIMQYWVHRCKMREPPRQCLVSYGGGGIHHEGRYDCFPFVLGTWSSSRHRRTHSPGEKPTERRFAHDERVYHAVAVVEGIKWFLGRTGVNLYASLIFLDRQQPRRPTTIIHQKTAAEYHRGNEAHRRR